MGEQQTHFPWDTFCGKLKQQFGQSTYNNWFEQLQFGEKRGDSIDLVTSSKLAHNWIRTHYLDDIHYIAKEIDPKIASVSIELSDTVADVKRPHKTGTKTAADLFSKGKKQAAANSSTSTLDRGLQEFTQLDARYTFDDFVTDRSNELAMAAARRIAESDEAQFNPLFLYGGVGLGKTHLMHAIAWRIRERSPERKVVYLSAEKFMYRFIKALRYKNIVEFKQQFRSVDVLMIDDLQFIAGKESTQEEFFHTFNALVDQNRQVILSADKSPADLTGIGERMKSRLSGGLVVDIHPATFDLRLKILQAKLPRMKERYSADIPHDVLSFMAENVTSSIRELEGALHRIMVHSDLTGRVVTIEAAHELLHDMIRVNRRQVSLKVIQEEVAAHFGLTVTDLHSRRRTQSVVRPRQIAMYLATKLTPKSLPVIGKAFGDRDHTTVMHAVKRVEELMSNQTSIEQTVSQLRHQLQFSQ